MVVTNNWYGLIPNTWKVLSFNQAIKRMGTGLNPRDNFVLSKSDDLYYVTIRNFKDNKLFLDENCDRISKQAWEIIQARSDLHKGDILFASISKDGQAYLLDSEPDNWNINESVFCIRVDEKLFDKRYFRYEITNTGYYTDLLLDATGTTFKSIKQNKLRQSKVVAPPMEEQRAIASYLDDRCSKLDEIIAEAEKSIEEYKELKQAVIFEAVTKGLDKNVPMKETGNIWLPMLPVNVPLSRLSLHYSIILGKMLCPNKRDEDDTLEPYYCAANVHFDGISGELKEMWFNTSEKENYAVHKNDMLIVEGGAGAGGAAIVLEEPEQPTFVQNSIMIVRSKDSEDNRYLCYLVQALVKNKYVEFVCNKATIPHFTKEKLSGIPYPVWSKENREKIADYLDERITQMDALISEKQSLIEDLKAYKKSLIYEVVTGKRRVV